MSESMPLDRTIPALTARVARVVEEVIRQRAASDPASDEEVITAHPELMPELGEKLRALHKVELAELRADGVDAGHGGVAGESLGPPDGVTTQSADAPSPPSDSFAGYQIVREIHRGGQGVVYQAIQKSTHRKVALKVMREGPFAGPADRARFEREVQILGQLQHPNIVTVHDSGSAAGVFYFVMDYIAGQPLDVYMASGPRTIDETLRLFAKICEAVNAAHLRGIIHRDLKPSNIRVDAGGQPHILDFGLAKLATPLASSAADGVDGGLPVMTLTGQFVGSLPWASPEQAEAQPSKIDVRTDVYSLGVILYQMLTSRFPYEVVGNMRDVLDRIMRAQPVRPSVIRKQINDEVETIVLKSLQKERERRYQSAGELARDIQHYLAGEPIEAKRDSYGYVVRKMLRRYRMPIAVALLFAGILLGSTIALAVMYRRQTHDRAQAEAARRLAEARANETEQVADFQARMLQEIDIEAMGRGLIQHLRKQVRAGLERQALGGGSDRRRRTPEQVETALGAFDESVSPANPADTARAVLDEYVLKRASDTVEKTFGGQPLVQAAVYGAIGRTYQALGLYDAAEAALRKTVDIRAQTPGGEPAEMAGSLFDLASLLRATNDLAGAEAAAREALAIYRARFGNEYPDVAASLNDLAMVLMTKGDFAGAEPLLREALALNRKIWGDDTTNAAANLNNLAVVLRGQGDLAGAEAMLREALALCRGQRGDEHPDVASALNNLAGLLQAKGEFAGAEPLFRQALAINRKSWGDEHPTVATSLMNLATLLQAQGDYAEAEALYREAAPLCRRLFGDTHPDTARCLFGFGMLLAERGDYAGAERQLREALAIWRAQLPAAHVNIFRAQVELGVALAGLARFAESEPFLLEGYAGYQDSLGVPARIKLRTVQNIVRLYEGWHAVEPEGGHDVEATAWRAKLTEMRSATRPGSGPSD
ncbi:MAG: serine/threonine-protein kinase [Planctomycetota bacterium]